MLLCVEWLVAVVLPSVRYMPRFRSSRMQVGAGPRLWLEMMANTGEDSADADDDAPKKGRPQ